MRRKHFVILVIAGEKLVCKSLRDWLILTVIGIVLGALAILSQTLADYMLEIIGNKLAQAKIENVSIFLVFLIFMVLLRPVTQKWPVLKPLWCALVNKFIEKPAKLLTKLLTFGGGMIVGRCLAELIWSYGSVAKPLSYGLLLSVVSLVLWLTWFSEEST